MTIATEITKLQTNLSNSYDAAEAKSATMPEAKNFDNLAECIASIPSGGGDEITVLNLTGVTLAEGDKVWLSPMYLGSTADVDTFSTSGYSNYTPVVVSRDGTTAYDILYGYLYNVSAGTSTPVAAQNTNPTFVKYAANGLVFAYNYNVYSSNNPTYFYWITAGGGSYNVATQYAYLGGDYYYDAANSAFVKMASGTMNVIKTYTTNISFNTSYIGPSTMCYANGYIYYCSNNSARYARAVVDDANQTVTHDRYFSMNVNNGQRRIAYATSDGKYFLSFGETGRSFFIYKLVDGNLIAVDDVTQIGEDLLPFYNNDNSNSTGINFNQQDDILILSNKTEMAVFKYSEEHFTKIADYIAGSATYGIQFNATASGDGSVLGFRRGYTSGSGLAYAVQFQGSEAYKAVSYQNINISADSFTGFVSVGGNQGETVKVLTVMPEELNVSVTVNADNAIVLGGIE